MQLKRNQNKNKNQETIIRVFWLNSNNLNHWCVLLWVVKRDNCVEQHWILVWKNGVLYLKYLSEDKLF